MGLGFDWDQSKARTNFVKHRVSFEEAATVFSDPLSLTVEDPMHSPVAEDRFVTMGRSDFGRLLVVVHSDRGDHIRNISARPATPAERRSYEQP